MGRDGPGKKSRTNSHRLAEWPQFRCNTSWCIDLCATMQRARVFSSLLYQDVMVLDVLKKNLHNPAKKPSSHKARTAHGDLHPAVCVRPLARPRASRNPGLRPRRRPRRRLSGSWSMQVGAAAAAAHLRNVFARAGADRPDSPPACFPQVRTMAAGAAGGRQVWACITTLRAGVRTEL